MQSHTLWTNAYMHLHHIQIRVCMVAVRDMPTLINLWNLVVLKINKKFAIRKFEEFTVLTLAPKFTGQKPVWKNNMINGYLWINVTMWTEDTLKHIFIIIIIDLYSLWIDIGQMDKGKLWMNAIFFYVRAFVNKYKCTCLHVWSLSGQDTCVGHSLTWNLVSILEPFRLKS